MGCRTGDQVHDTTAAVEWKPEWTNGRGRFREELGGSALIAVAINRGYCEVKVGEGSVDRIKGKMGLRQQGGCEILGARDVDRPLVGDVDVIAEFF